MRVLSLLIIALLLPSAGIALAEETDAISLGLPNGQSSVPIAVMKKADCVSFLETVFSPEEVITAGLDALNSAQNENPRQACLADILKETSGELKVSASLVPPLAASKYLQLVGDLNKKIACYNPEQPGGYYYQDWINQHKDYCGGTYFTYEEVQKLKADKKQLQEIVSLFSKAIEALGDGAFEESLKIQELQIKISGCGPNPYAPGSYDYKYLAEHQASKCGGKTYSKEEIQDLEKEQHNVNVAYQAKISESAKYMQKIRQVVFGGLTGFNDETWDRIDELRPLALELACTNPYPKSNPASQYWDSGYNSNGYCKGIEPGAYELFAERKQKFLAALGDPDTVIAKAKAKQEATIIKANAALLATTGDITRPYFQRRLLANFKGYLGREGDQASVAAFCENNEKEMKRDAKFSRLYFADEGAMKVAPFQGPKAWQHAEFGLTEAEFKAMTMYVGSFYRIINPPLFGHQGLDPDLSLYKDVLDSGLKKLPTFVGGPLKRHLTLSKELLDQHKLNDVITYDSYTSTSKATSWNWGGNAKMVIYGGKNGKDVSKYNEGEQEVIFLPGTRFRIIGKEEAYGVTNFVLGEVDDHGDLVAKLPVPKDYAP